MEKPTNIHDAKTHLSRLVERVEAGEDITLARAGRPLARLVPYRARREPRRPGLWRGMVSIGADFDEPIPAFDAAFEG
jgi:prevent-host-death family protein